MLGLLVVWGVLYGLAKTTIKPYRYNFSFPAFNETSRIEIAKWLGVNSVPAGYALRSVMSGQIGENALAAYFNRDTGQVLVVAQVREHMRDQSFVIFDKTKVERTFMMVRVEIPDVPSLGVIYQLPVFSRDDKLDGIGPEAIIRGVRLQAQDRFETEATYVVYFKGEFEKIGLFKDNRDEWRYPTPVFDFTSLHEGALAFVTSKASGRVIVCVSANSLGQFREDEFREFVRDLRPS